MIIVIDPRHFSFVIHLHIALYAVKVKMEKIVGEFSSRVQSLGGENNKFPTPSSLSLCSL